MHVHTYLSELHENKVLELRQILGVGGVFDRALVVDLSDELGFFHVGLEVEGVVPILQINEEDEEVPGKVPGKKSPTCDILGLVLEWIFKYSSCFHG